MAVNKTKERVNQLASDIRRSQNEASSAIKELLLLMLADMKDSLVSSSGLETVKLQGGAQTLERLHKLLTTEPPSIKPRGDQS